jgi:hypothetical protein
MPTAAQYPIPADLLQAFRAAIQAVRDWHRYGGAEPLVGYQGLPYHVSAIADHVAVFGDKMPYEVYREVCRAAGSTVDAPADQTYKAGAVCLYRLCMKLNARPSSKVRC